MVGVHVAVLARLQPDLAGSHGAGHHLADVLHRRHVLVIVLEGVEGVRVGGHDPANAGRANGLGVVIPQGHEQRLLAEAPDIVPAVALLRAENAEVLVEAAEDAGGGAPDRLGPIVVGGDAVDEVQRVCAAIAVQDADRALRPVGALLFHLSERIPAAFERLQRLVKRLRRLAVVDQAAA